MSGEEPARADDERERAPATVGAWHALAAAAIVTGVVTAASYLAPVGYAGTFVGGGFLVACYVLVLRHDTATVRAYGLALGGLTETTRLDGRRLVREGAVALGWALGLAALTFPPFFFGFRLFWHVEGPFRFAAASGVLDEAAGQLLVVALPEEAFFRGFLQTALDRAWRPRVRILGAELGLGYLLSAAIFAAGHFFTLPSPARLAVFFPALAFGWLRARTGGIGAGFVYHALCNLFASALVHGYGLG
ncbi:MAG: CPBP family intramembrane metalloprotease [Myxococcales bacterium]|nr:CPBP family intramembrane metalloprotease [Myxococcales bacterium]